ncbi:hypothetical protein M0R72_09430 [Candidatus Pacearchaeota archaeon]|jgi:hypothetical protein|nr:hypothetical protein [Candidatus Pacearchaeota archaeon]
MMNQDTPAINIRSKDLAQNALALRELLGNINPTEVNRVCDIRYGLGGWAQVVMSRFPNARMIGYEQDQQTADMSWKSGRVDLRVERWKPNGKKPPDLLLADFNTVTVLKRELCDEAAQVGARYFVFTDVACSYLHLNWQAYNLSSPDLDEYWSKFRVSGYQLVAFSKKHHSASTALYLRNEIPRR